MTLHIRPEKDGYGFESLLLFNFGLVNYKQVNYMQDLSGYEMLYQQENMYMCWYTEYGLGTLVAL